MFTGWTPDAAAFLAELADHNTREFFDAHRHRHTAALLGPTRELAAELEPEFGPVRVFRPYRNRRFRPDAPPYRTDTGGTARGGALAVVLTAAGLTTTAGIWLFDAGQLRRYRAAVDDGLARLLDPLDVDTGRRLAGRPRGVPADHPQLDLLRLRGLQVGCSWPGGEWLGTREPLDRVRAAWRAAGPLLEWLDAHVGPADPVPPRPRAAATQARDECGAVDGAVAADRAWG
ncbi:DUF2461 family protein [Pseudonocardia sp.]|uniref:DUF2461 family protein n=1 Tax=Pseudonocardia sp. TaxID=60912 RepID=UPI00262236AF|nr:DUF2461 family protein [Pseudonocardia sp.]